MMNKEPLLSVIVPVYKVEKYLNRCLDSIIKQTYKNLEINLVDDGSPDNSGLICDEYALKDKRVKVIHQKNKGISGARNTGIKFATGDYITFVDSDDWIKLEMYSFLMDKLVEFDLDIIKTAILETDAIAIKHKINFKNVEVNKVLEGDVLFLQYFKNFCCKPVWNGIYKKHIVKDIKFPEGYTFEDNYASGMYLYRSKKGMFINEYFYNYYINSQGISKNKKAKIFDVCYCTKKLIEDLQKSCFSNKKIEKQLNKKLARELYNYILSKNLDYRVVKIESSMKEYIYNNLSFRRKMIFLWKIYKSNI